MVRSPAAWISAACAALALLVGVSAPIISDRVRFGADNAEAIGELRAAVAGVRSDVLRLQTEPPVKTSVATEGRLQGLMRLIEELERDVERIDRAMTEVRRDVDRIQAR